VKINADENISGAGIILLRQGGHDVATVHEEGLRGSDDSKIFQACISERRVLITLDRDFGHVLRFPPAQSAGIVVLELGGSESLDLLHGRLRDFLNIASKRTIEGELWIVEPGRVRVRLERDKA
jgi:predicted nuclease of predicted toxin-antitoxin system